MKRAVCVLLVLSLTLLCGCVPSRKFLKMQEQGYYPTAADYPNTKWVCREIDMCLYMLDHGESWLMGTYTVDRVSYRLIGRFDNDRLDLDVYSSTEVSASEESVSAMHCEQISYGFIYTYYILNKETGNIDCDVFNYALSGKEEIPKTLTFEPAGSIAEEPSTRWYAQEIDLYLDSYDDIEDYFKGEIVLDGRSCAIQALEIGNDSYFVLSLKNGITNNLRAGTSSHLVLMYFEMEDDQIIAKVSDEYLSNTLAYSEWPYGDMIVTFKPVPPQR